MKISLATVFIVSLIAMAQNTLAADILIPCESAPKEAVIEVPSLVTDSVAVKCTKYGHILTSPSSAIYNYAGGISPAMLFADIESGKSKTEPPVVNHDKHFIRIEARKLTQEESKLLFPNILRSANNGNEATGSVEILAVNQDNITQRVYIFSLNGVSKWGYLCDPECHPNLVFTAFGMKAKNNHAEESNKSFKADGVPPRP